MMVVGALRRAFSLVRRFVILEIGIWRSLFLWVTRRVSGQGPAVEVFSYAKELAPLMGAFIFVSAIELPVVHVLLPWETVRLVLLVLSVWGLLWMIGFRAAGAVEADAGAWRVAGARRSQGGRRAHARRAAR